MCAFDQEEWEAVTTWQGGNPSAADVLDTLDAVSSATFSQVVDEEAVSVPLLRAGLVQTLATRLGSRSAEAVGEEYYAETGGRIRAATVRDLLSTRPARRSWNNRFANLVSGRFTELVFVRAYRSDLGQYGLSLSDATTARSFVDYLIEDGAGFELSVNVKNAGVQMREAERFFGLDPADTLPMATYKTFGAERVVASPLLYVYLVDWGLLPRLREAYWGGLDGPEQTAFRLMTSFRGLSRRLEDEFIAATVEARLAALMRDVGYRRVPHENFRTISAARCTRIFYEMHDRSPYVYRQRMNTDPNLHISVANQTVPFRDVIDNHLRSPSARATFLRDLRRQTTMRIPDPPL